MQSTWIITIRIQAFLMPVTRSRIRASLWFSSANPEMIRNRYSVWMDPKVKKQRTKLKLTSCGCRCRPAIRSYAFVTKCCSKENGILVWASKQSTSDLEKKPHQDTLNRHIYETYSINNCTNSLPTFGMSQLLDELSVCEDEVLKSKQDDFIGYMREFHQNAGKLFTAHKNNGTKIWLCLEFRHHVGCSFGKLCDPYDSFKQSKDVLKIFRSKMDVWVMS